MKKEFRFIKRQGNSCVYEADFWEGPVEAGQTGRYVRHTVEDIATDRGFLNTAPSVSFYSELLRSFKKARA